LVIGIARGGLIPAVALCHTLGTRRIGVVEIVRSLSDQLYSAREAAVVTPHAAKSDLAGKSILIVDDIIGDGTTILLARDEIQEGAPKSVTTASLALNLGSRFVPDLHIFTVDDWVIFPWEHPAIMSDTTVEPLIPPSL
jgi:hypothetical protein